MRLLEKYIALFLICILPVAVNAQKARSEKRGVSENNFNYAEDIESLSQGVSWFYNWGSTPPVVYEETIKSGKSMTFIPMAWNGSFSESAIRACLEKYPDIKYILGFNEPNFTAQANMTPAQAAELWPRIEKIAEDFNLKIVGPALNYSPNQPYTDPTTWYDEFFSIYPEARCDYLALHCYMDGADGMMSFIDKIAERYNKKIWLTEFCAWESKSITAETQKSSLVMKVEALELSPNVDRYAWFKARGNASYPYYPLVKYPSETVPKGTLTELGEIYVNMSTFDLDYYYPMGTKIPATNYVKSEFISLELNSDPESPFKLQLEKFGIARTVDYLVDVTEAGTYPLYLRMASEENMFNPHIEVYSDGTKVGEQEFEATGGIGNWQTKSMSVTLPAGKQRITLKSTKNTTCKISWWGVNLDPSGINSVATPQMNVNQDGNMLYVDTAIPVKNIRITDMSGRTLKEGVEENRLDTSSLISGIYLLTVYFSDGTAKTIKQIIR